MSSNILYKRPIYRYDPSVRGKVLSPNQFCFFVDSVDPKIPTWVELFSLLSLASTRG